MLRIAGVCALLFTTGCLVETAGGGGGGGLDDDNNTLDRVCTTQLAVTGSFVQSKPPPLDEETGMPTQGCWPVGIWTFSAAIESAPANCPNEPALLPEYQFKVEELLDDDGLRYQDNTYMTDPSVRHRVKVSEGGAGLCQGELNLFSADGKEVWIIKPSLYADLHLGGDGEYMLYNSDQWLGDAD
jgi:hypothetical protein